MEIHSPGKKIEKIRKIKKLWWVGMKLECNWCGCRFKLEKNDESSVVMREITDFRYELHLYDVDCPFCSFTINIGWYINDPITESNGSS